MKAQECACAQRRKAYRELQTERLPIVAQRECGARERRGSGGRRRGKSGKSAEEERVAHIAMRSRGMLHRVEQQVVSSYTPNMYSCTRKHNSLWMAR